VKTLEDGKCTWDHRNLNTGKENSVVQGSNPTIVPHSKTEGQVIKMESLLLSQFGLVCESFLGNYVETLNNLIKVWNAKPPYSPSANCFLATSILFLFNLSIHLLGPEEVLNF
jgi:hypothetical protein